MPNLSAFIGVALDRYKDVLLAVPPSFDPSKLSLSILFEGGETATRKVLRIIVSYDGHPRGSFFLHNAYSTPERQEAVPLSPKRAVETTADALRIGYPDFNTTHDVAHNTIIGRAVQPNHPVEGDPWDPPFFYEDARHVFYVTTEGQASWVPEWNSPWISPEPPWVVPNIPPLVVPPIPIPDPIGPVTKQPGFGAIDPSPVARYVTEDAYVHRGIGTSGTVRYGEKEIGVAGSQGTRIRTK